MRVSGLVRLPVLGVPRHMRAVSASQAFLVGLGKGLFQKAISGGTMWPLHLFQSSVENWGRDKILPFEAKHSHK